MENDDVARQLLELLELYFETYTEPTAENISAAELMDDLRESLA